MQKNVHVFYFANLLFFYFQDIFCFVYGCPNFPILSEAVDIFQSDRNPLVRWTLVKINDFIEGVS